MFSGDESIRCILEDSAFVDRAMGDLEADGEYILSRENPIRILYRHRESTVHSIKIKATLEHHPARVISIPYEWDLLTQWNRFCLDAVKFCSDNPLEALVYGASWMFPPFKDFQACMRATGFDLSEEHGALLIAVRNADAHEHATLPAASSKRRWVLFLDDSYIVLKPLFLDDGSIHTQAWLSVHLDPKIPGIPSAAVNWVLHVFAPYLFKAINKTLNELFHDGSVYIKRMEASPAVYSLIHNIVEDLRVEAERTPR
jgi:hypothetical protein